MKRKGYHWEYVVDLILRHWLKKTDDAEAEQYCHMLRETGVTDGKEELEEVIRSVGVRDMKAEKRREQAYEAFLQATCHTDRRRLIWRWSVAVIVLLLGVGGVLLILREKQVVPKAEEVIVAQSKAYLTLSDGSQVDLDIKKEILVVNGDSLKIVVDSNRQLHYVNMQKDIPNKKNRYNTLTIPRGCEYFISLSDGTKIWLEADSYLEYPEVFGEEKREVKLKGEAYFEVAKDSLRPFIVRFGEYRMQVYGTEFDLNTNDGIQVQLILVKGSVGFQANESAEEVFLMPGQLGEANILTGEYKIQDVDVNHYISWKDGYIIFENECLESIMEKISRWYDVDVFFV